jgi:hypothetical protein
MQATTAMPARRSATTHRWIRQLHLWIGAWGALAAIVYGCTGLVMNHRFGDSAWPQGDNAETGRATLVVPMAARATPEQLSLWLKQSQGLDAQVIRKSPPPGGDAKAPQKWQLSGGTASDAWAVDYVPGNEAIEVKHTQHTLLAAFNRLHKGVGGGLGWRLLADSFALCMMLLGLSGLYMWARGRSLREMAMSVLGVSVVALALVLVPALL